MHPIRRPARLLAAALAALLAAPAARAQNLVTNPGFENGIASGGVNDDAGPFGFTFAPGVDSYASVISVNQHSGDYAFSFGGATGTISQTIATTAGATYHVGFFAYGFGWESRMPGYLTVTFGGTTVWDGLLWNMDYEEFGADVVATGSSMELTLSGEGHWSPAIVDDLSVTAGGTTTTPEPGTWALLATGLAGVGVAARRRRTR